jgi:uncharacterized membrane protein YbaN (DUF454 family)
MDPRSTSETTPLPLRWARKIVVAVVGVVTILIGVVGLFLPILQGVLLIVLGLAILATEFPLARRGLDALRSRFRRARERRR